MVFSSDGVWHVSCNEFGVQVIPMTPQDKTLVKKLTIAVLVKLVVLVALWWGLVREQRVTVDAETAATQLLGADAVKKKE
jgi:hypothetical protein